MIINILVGALFIGIGIYIGFLISGKYKNRVSQLGLCELMLERIKIYLEYEKTPTKSLIERLSESDSLSELTFIKRCHLRMQSEINFPQVWNECLERSKGELALNNEDYATLRQLAEVIGAYDASAQAGGIEVLQKVVNQQLEQAQGLLQTEGKMYRSLGTLAGIAVAILLL